MLTNREGPFPPAEPPYLRHVGETPFEVHKLDAFVHREAEGGWVWATAKT